MNASYFGSHASLSAWVRQAELVDTDDLVREDASKRERLQTLHQRIGLPIVMSRSFCAGDVLRESERFREFAEKASSTKYAVRAKPKRDGLPILRNRNETIRDLIAWLSAQGDNIGEYAVDFEPHIDAARACIFVVEDERIAGEAIEGGLLELNKGPNTGRVLTFEYDFAKWTFASTDEELTTFVQSAVGLLQMDNAEAASSVAAELDATSAGLFIKGYYEAICASDAGIVFVDFNRVLGDSLKGVPVVAKPTMEDSDLIVGRTGSPGRASGRVRIVSESDAALTELSAGEVLVCQFTSPDFLHLMKAAAAVVTDVGGVLSHAAIVCRELRKPCVLATGSATTRLTSGDIVDVDATNGYVRRVSRG